MADKSLQDKEKKLAAEKAVEYIENGMTVGLGTGSTVYFAIRKLGEKVKQGLKIKAVSSSNVSTDLARSSGIEPVSIDDAGEIDINIDGADEADRDFNGIKGGGGALLFEKIVALNSGRNIWIVDSGKLVKTLGKFPLPVEVIPFGHKGVLKILEEYNPVIRKRGDSYYKTDSGNLIFDLNMNRINDPLALDMELKQITGIVETGLFINIADTIIIGKENSTEVLFKK
ncbi:MAG: ribose-5-phosphate isomerase RpiA [Bacteroidetes bacterium]|nr:ribose-5-phosphate isomerase RpiA [Bacteroidota bacterium]